MIGSSAPITREIKSFGPSIETVKLDGPFPGLESGSDDDANLVKTLQDMESMAIKYVSKLNTSVYYIYQGSIYQFLAG